MQQGGAPAGGGERPSLEARITAAKADVARRLRYVRHHHPDGPFTLAGLAERAGVSKRTLSQAESADGSNLTLETLLKVSDSLGIPRPAYFLDEQVFRQVNGELAGGGPASGAPPARVDQLSRMLSDILDTAARARCALQDLPADGNAAGDGA
ncbi:helix-turn-helix domain-containing protein [Streptomyces mobaraensis]|uniref:Helix-turn-helix transcriptional regulator n=1 Tax=Streptomyces mobaraensis TaxID=35621 RepID=A0A5N5W9Q8_STRMB|nr:helix-turn-helix domain-containing protein [Streptomyces mobaraensis]KAB7847243.1 helix-turn-helix transcriptional regulator [Streptomyces mobaraensis]